LKDKAQGAASPLITGERMPAVRILVMDDEEPIRLLLSNVLKRNGHSVDFSVDGVEAVMRYQAAWREGNPYEVLIMDLTVPGGLGGCEALSAIKGINPNVKAIVASGYSSDPIMANYKAFGFSGMVPKPFDADSLNRVLAEVLSKPRSKVSE
jgi:CheY-like chemotaxis protein